MASTRILQSIVKNFQTLFDRTDLKIRVLRVRLRVIEVSSLRVIFAWIYIRGCNTPKLLVQEIVVRLRRGGDARIAIVTDNRNTVVIARLQVRLRELIDETVF